MNLEQAAELNPKEFCRDCHKPCWEECANCYAPLCDECIVTCFGCFESDRLIHGEVCIKCAPRKGYEKRGEHWYCENCPEEL